MHSATSARMSPAFACLLLEYLSNIDMAFINNFSRHCQVSHANENQHEDQIVIKYMEYRRQLFVTGIVSGIRCGVLSWKF